jgi:RNA polymerase sigma-70 factor (ECF subfamily)
MPVIEGGALGCAMFANGKDRRTKLCWINGGSHDPGGPGAKGTTLSGWCYRVSYNVAMSRGVHSSSRVPFAATRWSMVLAAAGRTSRDGQAALAKLCETYWYPLYAFVRRQGSDPHAAQDLTQAFFARLLEKDYLESVDPGRGKFRSFLLACLKHFLSNERDRERALKRGGGKQALSFDAATAENRYALEPADRLTPERLFERRWATTLLEQTLTLLKEEHESKGRGPLFERLKVYLTGACGEAGYAAVGEELGMTEAAVKKAVQRLRSRYKELLREQIAQTVSKAEEVDEEIRDLFKALG